MLPITEATGRLVKLTRNGVIVPIIKTEYIKGVEYAFFPASSGDYVASYDKEASVNQPPVVDITTPANNATFTAPASITITANASDADGVVSKVEFYNGDQKIGEDVEGGNGWSYTWNNVTANTYTLTANAFDNSGDSSSSAQVKIEVTAVCPCTVFAPSLAPSSSLQNDEQAIQVGMKFRASSNGYVTGVRFYKQSGNTGTHTGQLYSSSGALLASVVFSNETASGWQQALFSSPVAITAGTTYVISYHSSAGNYTSDYSYFNQAYISEPLRALADGEDGPNGLYRYTSSPAFPASNYQASNYWVDVVFSPDDTPANQPPMVSMTAPANNATFTAPATITLTADASDTDGTVSKVEFFNGTNKLGEDTDGGNGWSFDWDEVPAGSYTLTARTTDDQDAVTTSSAVTITVTGGTLSCPCTVFKPTDAPANALYNDGQAIQVGMKFRASSNGYVTGVRFYKQSGNTGTHTGQLYSSSGTLLASVEFTGETASGWQQAAFSSPVAITAGTTYVISYHSSAGNYTSDYSYFNQAYISEPLRALADGEDGPNGLYRYTSSPAFPASNYQASNYWVDVVFSPDDTPANQPPMVSMTAPANNATFTAPATITLTADASDTDGTVSKVEFFNGTNKLGEDTDGGNGWSFDWDEVPAGSYTLTARTTDDQDAVTTSSAVTITVNPPTNQPPVVAITSPKEGASFTAPASITIVAAASDADGSVSKVEFFNGETKLGEATASPYEYSWTSVGAGTYQLMARATDNSGAVTNSDVVNISITAPENRPPVVANPIADQAAVVGVAFSFTFSLNTFADPDEDPLIYTSSLTDGATLPAWLTFNGATRTFSGTPPAGSQGQLSIRVIANDGRGGTANDDFSLTIVQPDNQAPVLASIGNKTVNELSQLSFIASATDDGLPNNSLIYSMVSPVAEASINPSTGAFSWTPTEAQGPGSYTFTIRVSDGELSDEELITVQVAEVNQAPVLATVGNKEIGLGQTLMFTLQSSDVDIPAQTLTYSANKLPAGATLNANTGEFSWAPTSRQVGSHKIIFRVSDGIAQVNESITITVKSTPVASAPVIASFSPTSGKVGDQVVISGSNLTGASAVAFNGVLALIRENSASSITVDVPAGATTGKISVSTPGGTVSSEASFTVTGETSGILPYVSITSPANSSSYTAPASVTISATASDPDGTVVRVEFFQGNTKLGEGTNGADGWSLVWNNVAAGSYALTARATDNTGLSATSEPINISVTSISTSPPLVTSFSPPSGPVGESVLISGNNLSTTNKITFGPSNAEFTVDGNGNLIAKVPAVNGKLPSSVKITVTTPSGNNTTSDKFTITSGMAASVVSSLQKADVEESEGLTVYPNPFSDKATISFTLQEDSDYYVRLYDNKGALVAFLKHGYAKAGEQYNVEVDGSKQARGLYLVRLQTDAGSKTVKLILDR
ncbi:DUF4082 domain-containing protein [Pontibacter ramchanderi]|nr:DUF4082 domain-containing protein [Pontibacter ramchanderi]